MMATGVLLINISLTAWASIHFSISDGIGESYIGSCEVVDRWALWLHLLINALSSALLSASNYTMQCVISPTRKECDKAHARGDWLDIGVPSIRNLSRIQWRRRIIWTILATSSIPIHLLYNSAVFKTIDSNSYSAILANSAFLDSGGNVTQALESLGRHNYYYSLSGLQEVYQAYMANKTSFSRLDPRDCITVYGTSFVSGHINVVVITNETGSQPNETVFNAWGSGGIDVGNVGVPYSW